VNVLYAGVSAMVRPARIARAERNMPLTWTLMSVMGRALNGVLLALIFGSISDSVLGYGYIKATCKGAATYELPFGTLLGAAALAVAMVGPRVLGYGGL
jgi:hypothetical protein